jgi:hypothetical protein
MSEKKSGDNDLPDSDPEDSGGTEEKERYVFLA